MSFSKRFVAGSLAAVMTMAGLTGCSTVRKSDISDDYSQDVVATYGDENIYLDEVNYLLRNRQYMYEYYSAMYGINFWNSEEYVDGLYEEVMQEVLQTRVLCEHAADYNVELTDEEKEKVTEAVDSIVEADDSNSNAFYNVAGRDETMLTNVLTMNALANKVYYTILNQCEITTTEEDCIQDAVTYFLFPEAEEETEAETTEAETTAAETTEAETTAAEGETTEAETTEAATTEAETEAVVYSQEDADAALAEIQAGSSIDDVAAKYGQTTSTANYGINDEQDTELGTAAIALKEGESTTLYVEGTGWYVIYCTAENDEDATAEAYESAVEEEKENYFTETYDGLSKKKFKVIEQVYELLDVVDTPVYGITETEEETTEAAAEAVESETAEAETTEAATTAAQ